MASFEQAGAEFVKKLIHGVYATCISRGQLLAPCLPWFFLLQAAWIRRLGSG
jgi:hypothetical protein